MQGSASRDRRSSPRAAAVAKGPTLMRKKTNQAKTACPVTNTDLRNALDDVKLQLIAGFYELRDEFARLRSDLLPPANCQIKAGTKNGLLTVKIATHRIGYQSLQIWNYWFKRDKKKGLDVGWRVKSEPHGRVMIDPQHRSLPKEARRGFDDYEEREHKKEQLDKAPN
jgi:hypothetical protein